MKNIFSKPPLPLVTLVKRSLLTAGTILAITQQAWAACSYTITNNWGGGFTGEIKVTNDTAQTINNWSVSWKESAATISSAWNATLSGSNPYSATALSWNSTLAPKASASFGFQGTGTAAIQQVTGSLCGAVVSSSSVKSSSSTPASSSAKSSLISSINSSVKSSVASSSSIKNS